MSLIRQLVAGVAKLSLRTATVLRPAGSTHISTPYASQSFLLARFFQLDAIQHRKLDAGAHAPSKLPSSRKNRWAPLEPFSEKFSYTIKPLPFPKTGGRGPNGRIWNHRRAGGHKRNYRMIDSRRAGGTAATPNDGIIKEKVEKILYDPNRSARIALVGSGEHKRYVVATENMKAGDIIKSTQELSRFPVRPVEGDAHPLGSLPLGTLVCCVERTPGSGAVFACSAGVTALLVRRQGDNCIIRLPSKREIEVSVACMATVGRVSNINHNKRVIGKAGRNRWLGIRPHSGRWHRKTGRFGRKIHPPKPVKVYAKPVQAQLSEGYFTVSSVPGLRYNQHAEMQL